jgi:1,4-dihydroxy-2-naphthoate octaprenyltransferase
VAPVLLGSALAWQAGGFSPAAASICLGFALLVQIGTNFANDYYDFVKGADTAARVGPTRAVAAGLVKPAAMRRAMSLTFGAAFLLGLGLIVWGGPWLIVIGLASIACGYAYTGGPYPLGYHGWGDVFVFLFFGIVAVGATYFVQAGWPGPAVWLLGGGTGLLAANILVVNNYRDAETDAAAGKRTLVVRFGRGFARVQFAVSWLLAFAVLPVAAWSLGSAWGLLLPGVLVPLAWSHGRRLAQSKTPGELIELLGDTGRLLALYALLAATGLWLTR